MQCESSTTTASPCISEAEFKQGMQLLAGCVNVITASYGDERRGMTATAVCSLSADPPSLVVSVNRSARTFDHIADSRKLCVNLLASHQQNVANSFASSKGDSEEKFRAAGQWESSASGLPLLQDCVANFVCEVDKWMVTKTHCVIAARITEIRVNPDAKPLLYFDRQYSGVMPELTSAA